MGLNFLGNSGESKAKLGGSGYRMSAGVSTPKPPEPNPKQFTILKTKEINGWTIALVHYPACTTYGGKKLMVFDCEEHVVRRKRILDPHFLRTNKLSPIARFPPTDQGIKLAGLICKEQKE